MENNWDEVTDSEENEQEECSVENLQTSVKRMIREVSNELHKVHTEKYDEKRAIKTAALALKAQMDLAEFLSDVEGTAKGTKNAVKTVESQVYFDYREASEKKISEAALQQMVAKDKRTIDADFLAVDAEKTAKKWANLFGTLKDAHIFFRNLGKNDWSI